MEGESRCISAPRVLVRHSVSESSRTFKVTLSSDSVRIPRRLLLLNKLFDVLLRRVKRLLVKYPDWLSLERCQIDFYHEQLCFLSRNFERRLVTDRVYNKIEGEALRLLASEILTSKHARGVDPPDLTRIREQLASQVAMIHKAFFSEIKDFHCHFHFHKKKFEECDGEGFVGFQEEVTDLLHQLASITKKQLQVISIVGMAGLGKTTLATRLYNDPYVVSYFYVRAWVTCSQVYRKRDLLLSILSSVIEMTTQVCAKNDNMLAHDLYCALKGRRYLIVIDDIWSIKAWDDFKSCFPDDNNGSRVMLTTRLKDIALHAQTEGNPLCLRFLTEDESFDLFKRKTFVYGNISRDLSLIGLNIMKKCRGLPLAIVVIAGVLKYNMEIDWWTHVAEIVSSYIVTDVNQYIDTLALSYNHLPQHLRACFLSFGAFPEDHDIPVYKLTWLWIAKGFILEDGTKKSLEDVAEGYLMDLIRRSLVVVGRKGSNGAIKTCRIHDLLRDLCLRKAEEENFPLDIYKYNKHSYSCPHSSTMLTKSRLYSRSGDVLNIPSSCPCYSPEISQSFFLDVSIHWDTSKLIRDLNISSIELFVFPCEVLQLVRLRYLELRFTAGNPPESISVLRELQTLIMSSSMDMVVPKNLWKMINMRHLFINSGENLLKFSSTEEPSLLKNMQTMSQVSPIMPCQHIFAKTPNLQKLGLCGPLTMNGELKCPDLGPLTLLESLKLVDTIPSSKAGRVSNSINSIIFPASLKNLTLSNTYLDWREEVFQMMPNLEVLKLKCKAFSGNNWGTSAEAFPRLKFLKLDELDIGTWTASRDHFPVLQQLQVYRCPNLMEIPEDFGNIYTLEWIEVSGCSDAAIESARDIKREQERNGNDWLKILLSHVPSKPRSMLLGIFGSVGYLRNRFEEQPQVEVFIGFQEEASYLLQKLVSITKKQLEVISIVGMAGLGKTTLAKKLYNDPYVVSYFYIRAWVVCSHVYNKRDLLLVILRSINEITDDVQRMNDNMPAHVLYRALKGRRYLIVIDDVWSSSAWDDFKRCFPGDNNGSKIMLTTQFKDVALHAQSDGNPLCLRFLTGEESFNLFPVKVSRTGYLLDDLSFIGKSITKTCRGLPLAIVVIAGLLKGNFNVDWWEQVAESVSSYIATDETQYMDTLALSYNHLPRHLRPCFLSFGAFLEDYDIPVRKLIWLWIAEGFIPQDETEKSLEGVAKDYLMDLISRSLVCVGKRGSNGAIKTCRIHDLLRDLALRRADEENFSPNMFKFNKHSFSCPHSLTNPSAITQLRLTTEVLDISSNCSCCSSEVSHLPLKNVLHGILPNLLGIWIYRQ